ncbi:hypothetical protein LUZ63_003356 [Rhynchospora breviuscula]|uniref:F-box domain-containing protein n=1 Tax=Rhynchospora breviuscula TaxID=2022672 RepID=A0A9Q0D0I1_9POAL|nr:hypothetical protein LUZ63_003356 [Rhynchospora breviuscula]
MSGVDRISALPEELKVSILSLLTITDAVRTSVLSRSWCRLWTFLPGLRIDRAFLDSLRFSKGPDVDLESGTPPWIGIVEHLLSSFCGPIRYFTLSNYYHFDELHLNGFVDLIFQKCGLQKLSITKRDLPQLACYSSLKDLCLDCVRVSIPTDFQGFDQLTTLKLYRVFISQRDINVLVNQSKKLTSFLQGEGFRSLDFDKKLSVTFNCPLLKSISFQFEIFQFQRFRVDARIVSAPCLESVCVSIKNNASSPKKLAFLVEPIMKFMADIAHVCDLYLDPLVIECLSVLYVVDELHTFRVHFHQLRCLKLDAQRFWTERRMFEIFCHLLRSMPCLNQLQIMDYDPVKDVELLVDPIPPNKYMKKQDGFHCLDQTLTRVEVYMDKLTNLNHIMWMMYLFLFSAKVLELLKITFSEGDPRVISRITSEELFAVEKASLNAKVVEEDWETG